MEKAITEVDEGFAWEIGESGRALVANALKPLALHLFTTRTLHFRGELRGDDYRRLARTLGVTPDGLLGATQVHGRTVHVVAAGIPAPGPVEADAIISTDPARAVMVRIADCVPILLADRHRRVVAAIHAGWRGTGAGVAAAAVEAIARLGIVPGDLVAAIGPSAGPCCYQVDGPVHVAFLQTFAGSSAWFTEDGAGKWKLDLWRANVDQLTAAGIAPEHVCQARLCTVHARELFHSYRRDGAAAGRMVAAIRLAPPARAENGSPSPA